MSGIALIQSEGSFDASIRRAINSNFSTLAGAVVAVGNVFFLDPANGSDSFDGLGSATPKQTLTAAYNLATAGNNDVVVLMANGATTATARVDAAFTWAKNETHLLGFCAPVYLSQRARIAPTASTTAFSPFFTVSGSGCIFQNVQWFHGFTVGTSTEICMTVTGSRNYFANCHFAGMGDTDAASAAGAGSRSLKIGSAGSGENVFYRCTVGIDTITRSAANASLELAGATARNSFIECLFPVVTSASTPLYVLGTGADCVDRWQYFENCRFINNIKSGSTQMTVAMSLTNAAPGGLLLLTRCSSVGSTKWGDTNALANTYVDGGPPTAATSGLAVNPT